MSKTTPQADKKATALERLKAVMDEVGERNEQFSEEEVTRHVMRAVEKVRKEEYARKRAAQSSHDPRKSRRQG